MKHTRPEERCVGGWLRCEDVGGRWLRVGWALGGWSATDKGGGEGVQGPRASLEGGTVAALSRTIRTRRAVTHPQELGRALLHCILSMASRCCCAHRRTAGQHTPGPDACTAPRPARVVDPQPLAGLQGRVVGVCGRVRGSVRPVSSAKRQTRLTQRFFYSTKSGPEI